MLKHFHQNCKKEKKNGNENTNEKFFDLKLINYSIQTVYSSCKNIVDRKLIYLNIYLKGSY